MLAARAARVRPAELLSTMINNKHCDFRVTCFLLAAAAVISASCSSEVTESISNYSCCKAELQFNSDCEIMFTTNRTNFAFFKGERRSCSFPCRKLEDGVMKLAQCAAVVGVAVCADETNVVEEEIQYRSQPCPVSEAPGNQGSVRLLLVTSMICMLIVKKFW